MRSVSQSAASRTQCNKCEALRLCNTDKVKYNDTFDQIIKYCKCDNILTMAVGAFSAGFFLYCTWMQQSST